MQLEEFQHLCGDSVNVSRESFENLQKYHALLVKWQRAINIVSPKTLDIAWERHFVDSAQMIAHIPPNVRKIADLGSGGGFPAMVMAISRPDLELNLIESDERKAQFLRNVSRESSCGAIIHNDRVERVLKDIQPDLITARAFASLKDILDYAWPTCEAMFHVKHYVPDFLLMKGRDYQSEIDEAADTYDFQAITQPSKTDPDAVILSLKEVRKKDSNS